MPIPQLQTRPEVPLDAVGQAVLDRLRKSIDFPIRVFVRQNCWLPVDPETLQVDADAVGIGIDDSTAVSILDSAAEDERVSVVAGGDSTIAVVVSLTQWPPSVKALVECNSETAALAAELARATCELVDARRQARRPPNAGTTSLDADRDELRFLRCLARQSEEVDLSQDLAESSPAVLALLRVSIRADSVVLLTPGQDPVARVRQFNVAVWEGAQHVTEQVALAIAERYVSKPDGEPTIRHYQADGDDDCFPAVEQFVLCPIGRIEQPLGWLLAINRNATVREERDDSDTSRVKLRFGAVESRIVAWAASMLASQGRNYELFRDLQQLVVSVLRTLVTAIEAKDPYTSGHSERVALYARALANASGFDEESCDRIYLTGLLHDIGKIGISDTTLQKPGKLTEQEYAEIKRHPDLGWSILQDLAQLSHVLPGVVHHHERIDGGGYPDGLAGDQIPLDGRVLAVADAFDAMTSDRPYRGGMPIEQAHAILRDGAGTQWDSRLVEVFCEILPEIRAIKDAYRQTVPLTRSGPITE